MSDNIPRDVLTEILLRLPVKSLLRFRSVSHSWNSLISSPAFVSLYSGEHHSHRRLFINLGNYIQEDQRCTHEIVIFHPDESSFRTNQHRVPWPFSYWGGYHLVGSCNGLLCIYFRGNRALCLWNPAIRKHLTVEPPPMGLIKDNPRNRFTAFMYGFAANEYKIATIEGSYLRQRFITYHGGGSNMYVYELSKNSWRKKKTDPNWAMVATNGSGQVSYKGGVHWIGRDARELEENWLWKVIRFDVESESYREMGVPEGLSRNGDMKFSLLTVTERMRLGLVQLEERNRIGGCCFWVVWEMEDYGEVSSWKKKYSVFMGLNILNARRKGQRGLGRRPGESVGVLLKFENGFFN
ncbi:F-box/kelch-repeat protein At3g06240 [Linum perenne]